MGLQWTQAQTLECGPLPDLETSKEKLWLRAPAAFGVAGVAPISCRRPRRSSPSLTIEFRFRLFLSHCQ
jgi:hypothetical protein